MSNPLELTIYPRLEKVGRIPEPGYVLGKKRSYPAYWADRLAETKHLTDAELAAEFEAARCDYLLMQHTGGVWTPLGETWPMNPQDTGHRVGTLHRFAIAAHYYEETE